MDLDNKNKFLELKEEKIPRKSQRCQVFQKLN